MSTRIDRGPNVSPKRFHCDTCGKHFDTEEAKHAHRLAVHEPHRRLSASDRPINRGPVGCGVCERTFANEYNAAQHRRDAHGIVS
jgi:transcription elongation factor Elf1